MKLKDIAKIQTGVYKKPDFDGDIIYLQAKHFYETGLLKSVDVLTMDLKRTDKLEKHILKNKDILFAAKGEKNFAFIYDNTIGLATASSTFFVIKIDRNNQNKILPEYLHWYLNHPKTIKYLKIQAKGSALQSVSKSSLENLMVPIPVMKEQQKILIINELAKKENFLLKEIMDKKEKLYQTLLIEYIKNNKFKG